MPDQFEADLVSYLPKLRGLALCLVRNKTDAEDLVHDTVVRALTARESFQHGTQFGAWLFCIMRHRFISIARRKSPVTLAGDVSQLSHPVDASQENQLILKETLRALRLLPAPVREAVMLVGLNDIDYEQAAALMGCPVGTAKTRVFRARHQLQAWMVGDRGTPAARPRGRTRRADRQATARMDWPWDRALPRADNDAAARRPARAS